MDEVKRLEELMGVYGLKIRIIPLDEERITYKLRTLFSFCIHYILKLIYFQYYNFNILQ